MLFLDISSGFCKFEFALICSIQHQYNEVIYHEHESTEYDESECELLVFGFIEENIERNTDLYIPFQLKQICKLYVIGKKGKYCCIGKPQ